MGMIQEHRFCCALYFYYDVIAADNEIQLTACRSAGRLTGLCLSVAWGLGAPDLKDKNMPPSSPVVSLSYSRRGKSGESSLLCPKFCFSSPCLDHNTLNSNTDFSYYCILAKYSSKSFKPGGFDGGNSTSVVSKINSFEPTRGLSTYAKC